MVEFYCSGLNRQFGIIFEKATCDFSFQWLYLLSLYESVSLYACTSLYVLLMNREMMKWKEISLKFEDLSNVLCFQHVWQNKDPILQNCRYIVSVSVG